MFVLLLPSVDATGDDEDCSRWSCPCAGQTKLKMFMTKRQNTQPVIAQSARQTRERTRQLLDRIVSLPNDCIIRIANDCIISLS